MSSSEVGVELVAAIAESAHPVGQMFSLVYLSGCVGESCIFVFNYRETNVVLQVNAELISVPVEFSELGEGLLLVLILFLENISCCLNIFHWINSFTILSNFIVQVSTCAASSITHVANNISPRYSLTSFNRIFFRWAYLVLYPIA